MFLASVVGSLHLEMTSLIRPLFEYTLLPYLCLTVQISLRKLRSKQPTHHISDTSQWVYFEGHVISNHSVELNLDCQDQCVLAKECVSYNIGPMINKKMACELSNSDHLQHPEDLKPRKDSIYRGTQV